MKCKWHSFSIDFIIKRWFSYFLFSILSAYAYITPPPLPTATSPHQSSQTSNEHGFPSEKIINFSSFHITNGNVWLTVRTYLLSPEVPIHMRMGEWKWERAFEWVSSCNLENHFVDFHLYINSVYLKQWKILGKSGKSIHFSWQCKKMRSKYNGNSYQVKVLHLFALSELSTYENIYLNEGKMSILIDREHKVCSLEVFQFSASKLIFSFICYFLPIFLEAFTTSAAAAPILPCPSHIHTFRCRSAKTCGGY